MSGPALEIAAAVNAGRSARVALEAALAACEADQLNAVIVRQQQQIDALTAQLAQLRQLLQQQPVDGSGSAFRSLRDELPPHY